MSEWQGENGRTIRVNEFKDRVLKILDELAEAAPEKREHLELELQILGRSFDLPDPPLADPHSLMAGRLATLLEIAESKNANYQTLAWLQAELTELGQLDKEDINKILTEANKMREAGKSSAGKHALFTRENIEIVRQ